jgi:hypothetical protein
VSSSTRSLPVTTTSKPSTRNLPTELPETSIFTTTQPKIFSTSSTTSFIRTTSEDFIDKNFKDLQDLLSKPKVTPFSRETTMESFITTEVPITTENFINKNFQALQELLLKAKPTAFTRNQVLSTPTPQTTQNFIDKNAQILQELLSKQTKPTAFSKSSTRIITTTEIPITTINLIDRNSKALQELLSKNRATPFSKATTVNQATTTEIPLTTEFEELVLSTLGSSSTTTNPTSAIQKIKRPSMQTRYTTVSFKPSSTTVRTTLKSTTEKLTTELPKTIPERTSTLKASSTTELPKTQTTLTETPSSTHRFVPIKIPSDFPTTILSSTTVKKSPFSDAEDLDFLVSFLNNFFLKSLNLNNYSF